MEREPIASSSEIPRESSKDQRIVNWIIFTGGLTAFLGLMTIVLCRTEADIYVFILFLILFMFGKPKKNDFSSKIIFGGLILGLILSVIFTFAFSLVILYRLFFTDFLNNDNFEVFGLKFPRWLLKIISLATFLISMILLATTTELYFEKSTPSPIKMFSLLVD